MIQTISKWITQLYGFVEGLGREKFIRVVLIGSAGIALILLLTLFFHYRSSLSLARLISNANDQREQIRSILERAERVDQERIRVEALFKKPEDSKIGGYFKKVVQGLHLADKRVTADNITQFERAENYRELNLTATFSAISMKEITQLLQELERNERIYVRSITISRNTKQPHTLEFSLTIGTVLPKMSVEGGEA